MDQVKIGKFIAARRKMANYTQMQLAEQLGITDRAVSKWETGRALPDSSLMLELCAILKISVNELLRGEVISMEAHQKEMEETLLELVRQKERADRRLLTMELVTGVVCLIPLAAAVVVGLTVPMKEWIAAVLVLAGLLPALVATPFMLRIEQTAGFYACKSCGHRHVPAYKSVFFAVHVNRTRYLRCPQCGKRTWQKKVLRKE